MTLVTFKFTKVSLGFKTNLKLVHNYKNPKKFSKAIQPFKVGFQSIQPTNEYQPSNG